MPNNEQPKQIGGQARAPRITLRLTNPLIFNVEVDYECPSLYVARAMLNEAVHSIQREIDDLEAESFGKRMQDRQRAFGAMQKNPGHA